MSRKFLENCIFYFNCKKILHFLGFSQNFCKSNSSFKSKLAHYQKTFLRSDGKLLSIFPSMARQVRAQILSILSYLVIFMCYFKQQINTFSLNNRKPLSINVQHSPYKYFLLQNREIRFQTRTKRVKPLIFVSSNKQFWLLKNQNVD